MDCDSSFPSVFELFLTFVTKFFSLDDKDWVRCRNLDTAGVANGTEIQRHASDLVLNDLHYAS